MMQKGSHSFQFYNAVSPIYVGALLLQLQHDQWYSTAQLVSLLRSNKIDIDGSSIVSNNTLAWSLVGLGQIEKRGSGFLKKNIFRLTELGKQLIDTYSTNAELFYDLIHFLFYSAY